MAPKDSEYGVRETREGDKHGEFDAWLEKAIEVANFGVALNGEKISFSCEWKEERILVMAETPTDSFAILIFGRDDMEGFPNRFRDLVRLLTDAMRAFNMIDFNTNDMLSLAKEMENEKKEREEALMVIGEAMELIFESEASQREAEERILQQWAEALSENGWIVSGTDLHNLTRLPILGKDSVLIYHGSPRYHPHYLRVSLQGGVKIEGISATRLSQVAGAKVVSMEDLATDEINIVASVLAAIVPRG